MGKNPFYSNHIFTEADLERAMITKKWYEWPWLFLYPTFVQVSDGYASHYKNINGCIYLMKIEKL